MTAIQSRDSNEAVTDLVPYQPLPFLFGSAVAGILVDRFIAVPSIVWGTAFFLAFFAWLYLISLKSRMHSVAKLPDSPHNLSTPLLLLAAFTLFGFWHHDRWNCFEKNDLGFYAEEIGAPAALRGTVVEMPRFVPAPPSDPGRIFSSTAKTLFTLRAENLRDGADWISVGGRVSIVVEGDCSELRIGDRIEMFGFLSKPVGPQNPGDFDFAARLRSQRVLSVFRCSSPESITVLKLGRFNVPRFLESIRRHAKSNLERYLSPETAPYAVAMLLGLREGVDEETTQRLMETGTMHILAISGLHVGLVAAMVGFLLRLIGFSARNTAIFLIVTVLFYLFLTDVRPPAIRATVLVCVVSAAVISNRRSLGVNTLCATALIVLALNPTELFQFGAQLSFIATGAFLWIPKQSVLKRFVFGETGELPGDDGRLDDLEWIEPNFQDNFVRLKTFLLEAVKLVVISLIIWLVTMPLILERIHLFTPIAVAVNPLLWLPLTAALGGGFLLLNLAGTPLLGPIIAPLVAKFTDISFHTLFEMIGFFQRLGGHYWMPGPPVWWNVVFYTVFVLYTFFPLKRPSYRTILIAVSLWIGVGLAFFLFQNLERRWNDRLTVSVFSVGHGNCVLITTPTGRTVVYDVGCISSPRRAADVVSRGLWRQGKIRIDAVVISHPDNDHFNGAAELIERFYVGAFVVTPYMFESLKRLEAELAERKITIDELGPDEFKEPRNLILLKRKLSERKIPLFELGDGNDLAQFGLPNSKILHPPKTDFGESDSSNAASLVLRFEHRGVGVLLPGDLDGRLTSPFLEREPIPCEIVMIPHHGGRSSQTESLLNWTQPSTLLISAGRFTHKDTVIEDFRNRGYTVRSTFLEGYIEISIDKKR